MATLPPSKKAAAEKPPIELQTVAQVFGLRMPTIAKSRLTPKATTNDGLLCGIELEIENLPEGHDWYLANAGDFWNVEEDGSLRPRGQAWEFISAPAPMGVVLAETEFLFENIRVTEERNYTDRCSIHLHTNVQDWTQQQVGTLALVYPVFEDVLFQFINHHKKKEEQGYCRDTNLYCIPWNACRHNRNVVEKLFGNPGVVRDWQKYTALNFLPIMDKGTVEWRHMHGTRDMEKLTMWFNIIGAIMRFSKETPFPEVVATIRALNDVSTYQQFFEQVLRNSLPYTEEYRRLMAEGVLNAKYSLVNWEANKGKSPEIPVNPFDLPLNAARWEAFRPEVFVQEAQPAEPQPGQIRLGEIPPVFRDPIQRRTVAEELAAARDRLARGIEEQRNQPQIVRNRTNRPIR